MALRLELSADAARGPGYGILRIHGLAADGEPLRMWVRRNQGAEPFLGGNGVWQTQQALHELPPPAAEGDALVVGLGPDLIDPIAILPPNCMVALGFVTATGEEQGRLTGRRILPSLAAGAGGAAATQVYRHDAPAAPQPVAEPQPEPEAEPEAPPSLAAEPRFELTADPVVPDPAILTDEPHKKLSGSVIAMIVALVLILAAGGWYFAGLPPFSAHPDAPAVKDVAVMKAEPVQPEAAGAIDSRESLSRYLATNPSAADATTKADELAKAKKLDYAMLVYQYASRLGSVEASLALGHMYDPDTWSKDASPMDKPDAETAAYWYEPAAQAGNVEAQRRLGKILVGLPQGGIQKDKGKEWLTKAAAAGDAEAKTLLGSLK